MSAGDESWLALATSRSIVRRALTMSCIVGTLLITINHGAAILRGEVGRERLFQMALTVLVPYCVSTYSSVGATRALRAAAKKR